LEAHFISELRITKDALSCILYSELFPLQHELEQAGLGLSAEQEVLTYDRMTIFVNEIIKKVEDKERYVFVRERSRLASLYNTLWKKVYGWRFYSGEEDGDTC
jgi:hypothetical protein